MTQKLILTVPAIGRNATFGDIYDITTDKFGDKSAFKIDESLTEQYDTPNCESLFLLGNDLSKKAEALEIDGTVKLRIFCGDIETNRSTQFLKHDNKGIDKVYCSNILKIKTIEEKIHWDTDKIKENYNFKEIENYGTHMVVGIHYGGNAVVTLSYEMDKDDGDSGMNQQDIEKFLKSKFNSNCKEYDITNDKNFNGYIYSDIDNGPLEETPAEYMKGFSKNLYHKNEEKGVIEGKGVIIAYEMIPLHIIFKNFGFPFTNTTNFHPLSNHIISELNQFICESEATIKTLFAHNAVMKNTEYFTTEQEEERKQLYLKALLLLYKKCKISDLIKLFYDNESAAMKLFNDEKEIAVKLLSKVDTFINATQKFVIKSDFINAAKKQNITYATSIEKYEQWKEQNKKFIVYFYSNQNYFINFDSYKYFLHHSKSLLQSKAAVPNIIVDAEIFEDFVKQELSINELPQHPLYIYENGVYKKWIQTEKKADINYVDGPKFKFIKKSKLAIGIDLDRNECRVCIYQNNNKMAKNIELLSKSEASVFNFNEQLNTNQVFEFIHGSSSEAVVSQVLLNDLLEIIKKGNTEMNEWEADVVLAVSANLNDVEKVREVAKSAGWNILHLLNKSTAAALAYNYQNLDNSSVFLSNILIFNFGAECSELAILRNSNKIEITNSNTLGRNQIDSKIEKYLREKIVKKCPSVSIEDYAMNRIVRHIQITLATEETWPSKRSDEYIKSLGIAEENADDLKIECNTTRAELENISREFVIMATEMVDEALNNANLLPQDINKVLIIGDFPQIPRIEETLKNKFGSDNITKNFFAFDHPDYCSKYSVAFGAAIQAVILTNDSDGLPNDISSNTLDLKHLEMQKILANSMYSKESYTLIKDIPNWSLIPKKEGQFLNYEMPESVEDIVNDVPLQRKHITKAMVQLAENPFARGAERFAFYGRDVTYPKIENIVLKEYLHLGPGMNSAARYETTNQIQTVGSFFAKEFSKKLESVTKKHCGIKFLKIETLSLHMSGKDYRFMSCEKQYSAKNEFIRFTNNTDYGILEKTAQKKGIDVDFVRMLMAFSHWTYQASKKQLMVVNLKGIINHFDGKTTVVLTDPAIHCTDNTRFGRMNLGERGMENFFSRHQCNHFCKLLGLTDVCVKADD